MKTYIIDASVAARFILTEDNTEQSRQTLTDFIRGEIDLTAPPLINYEVGNALRTAAAKKHIDAEEAQQSYKRILELRLGRRTMSEADLTNSLEWSTRKGVSLYDGVYIWLSKTTGYTLLTADDKQLQAAKDEADAIHLKDYK